MRVSSLENAWKTNERREQWRTDYAKRKSAAQGLQGLGNVRNALAFFFVVLGLVVLGRCGVLGSVLGTPLRPLFPSLS